MRDHELVTWSRDQCLRIWRIEPYLQRVSFVPVQTGYILQMRNTIGLWCFLKQLFVVLVARCFFVYPVI